MTFDSKTNLRIERVKNRFFYLYIVKLFSWGGEIMTVK